MQALQWREGKEDGILVSSFQAVCRLRQEAPLSAFCSQEGQLGFRRT